MQQFKLTWVSIQVMMSHDIEENKCSSKIKQYGIFSSLFFWNKIKIYVVYFPTRLSGWFSHVLGQNVVKMVHPNIDKFFIICAMLYDVCHNLYSSVSPFLQKPLF